MLPQLVPTAYTRLTPERQETLAIKCFVQSAHLMRWPTWVATPLQTAWLLRGLLLWQMAGKRMNERDLATIGEKTHEVEKWVEGTRGLAHLRNTHYHDTY